MINIIAINIIGGNILFSIHLDVRWSTLIFITYIVFNFFKKLLLYTIIFDKNYFLSYFKKNYIFHAFIKDLVHVMYTDVHIIIVRFIHLGLGFNLDWSL